MSIRKNQTYFFDIDGTLFVYRKFETYQTSEPEVVKNVKDSINKLYEKGEHIVFTTARPEYLREHTIKELSKNDIKYHKLVMEIGRGTRFLINDKEDDRINRAISINVSRNKGFTDEDLELLFK